METWKKLSIAATASALAAGVYMIVKKILKEDEEGDIGEELSLDDNEKANLLYKINVEYDGKRLTPTTIGQICGVALRFTVPEFERLMKNHRKVRRTNIEDLAKYSALCDDFTDTLNKLIKRDQCEVLRELNVSEMVWEESIVSYINEGRNDILLLLASLPQRLHSSIKSTKDISLEEFKQILIDMLDQLMKEANTVNEIVPLVSHPVRAMAVATNLVVDHIHEVYGIEEEDQLKPMKDFGEEPEVVKLLEAIQDVKKRLRPINQQSY